MSESKLQQIVSLVEYQQSLEEEWTYCLKTGEPYCDEPIHEDMAEPTIESCSNEQLEEYITILERTKDLIKSALGYREFDKEAEEEERRYEERRYIKMLQDDDDIPF